MTLSASTVDIVGIESFRRFYYLDESLSSLVARFRLCASKGMSHIIHMPSSPIYDLMFKPQGGKTAAKNSTRGTKERQSRGEHSDTD